MIWRTEFETLDELRAALAAYIDSYHDRPHSGLDYRTPKEVRQDPLEHTYPWYRRTLPLAGVSLAMVTVLNILF